MTVTRILVLKGYTNPFGEARTKPRGKQMKRRSSKRKMSYGSKRPANKMQSCAIEWKEAGKPGTWLSYAGQCLKKKKKK